MYLSRIRATNFRVFGDESPASLDWHLSSGLNILVGPNDAGKTAVIDAIRHVLWTTSYEFVRLLESDFHIQGSLRSSTLTIEATLSGLNISQEAAVLDWLTYESDGSRNLIIHLQARLHPPTGTRRGRIEIITRSGRNGVGPEVGSAVRELIRATYLRPLRDAEAELSPGRQSRLSQILSAHKEIAGQDINDFQSSVPESRPKNLVGLMAFAQHHLGAHPVVKSVEKDINTNYLGKFSFTGDGLVSRIQLAPDLGLQPILERFELNLLPRSGIDSSARVNRGLGYNNALFMATELVLLRDGDELGLLLVEEPEAHLHPQLQERVQRLLEQSANKPAEGNRSVQVVMTTHSPSLVSGADIACMTLVHQGRLYSLCPEQTKLKKADYSFLRRFMDATKANLFFARAVAIVEGPAEALLLPALAEQCGRSFSEHGVSIVNVGSVGLYHYARVLQRFDDTKLPVPVACITDRDVIPEEAKDYVKYDPASTKSRFENDFDSDSLQALIKGKKDRAEGGNTIVCVSDHWTFEYDLARYGCTELMFKAIALAKMADRKGERLDENDEQQALKDADTSWVNLKAAGHSIEKLAAIVYEPLAKKQASKAIAAQYAAWLVGTNNFGAGQSLFDALPPYLKSALEHLTSAIGEK